MTLNLIHKILPNSKQINNMVEQSRNIIYSNHFLHWFLSSKISHRVQYVSGYDVAAKIQNRVK